MARINTILILLAFALFAATECFVVAQGTDDRVKTDDLKRIEADVARIEAVMKRIERLVTQERAKLRESVAEIRKDRSNDAGENQAAGKDDQKPAEKPTEKAAKKPADEAAEKTAEKTASDSELDSMEQTVVKLTNAYRARRGLPPLQLDPNLSKASRDHSKDMKRLNFFSHQSPVRGKTRFFHRAEKFDTTASAENIARGATDGKSALELWVDSEFHRKNLVGDYRRIGVGRSEGFYTQMFGK